MKWFGVMMILLLGILLLAWTPFLNSTIAWVYAHQTQITFILVFLAIIVFIRILCKVPWRT